MTVIYTIIALIVIGLLLVGLFYGLLIGVIVAFLVWPFVAGIVAGVFLWRAGHDNWSVLSILFGIAGNFLWLANLDSILEFISPTKPGDQRPSSYTSSEDGESLRDIVRDIRDRLR